MKLSLLVVGGGIAGIVAALRARLRGDDVTLIEKEPTLGGLLASLRPGSGAHWFDHGTHIPAPTGNLELDRVLFERIVGSEWTTLPRMKAATFWNGKLGAESPCLDLRTLAPAAYAAVLREMLVAAPAASGVPEQLGQQLTAAYGPEMVRWVFAPVLRKFFNEGVETLAVDAHQLFGLSRFICAEAAQTCELKRDPALDRKLAFHSYRDAGPSNHGVGGYYPREGGAGRWIDGLETQLKEAGVVIRTGVATTMFDLAAGRTVLGDGSEVRFDRVAWSLPPGVLLRACGHPVARELSATRNLPGGIYNTGASDACSKYVFAQQLAALVGADAGLIRAAGLMSGPLAAPRPRNTAMDSRRLATALGCVLPTVEESLRAAVAEAGLHAVAVGCAS
jgi:protoporphyrinogen oxidase